MGSHRRTSSRQIAPMYIHQTVHYPNPISREAHPRPHRVHWRQSYLVYDVHNDPLTTLLLLFSTNLLIVYPFLLYLSSAPVDPCSRSLLSLRRCGRAFVLSGVVVPAHRRSVPSPTEAPIAPAISPYIHPSPHPSISTIQATYICT